MRCARPSSFSGVGVGAAARSPQDLEVNWDRQTDAHCLPVQASGPVGGAVDESEGFGVEDGMNAIDRYHGLYIDHADRTDHGNDHDPTGNMMPESHIGIANLGRTAKDGALG